MKTVVVIGTGGTIASTRSEDGGAVAMRGAADLLTGVAVDEIEIRSRDLFNLGSFLLRHEHLRRICEAVSDELAREEVDGVVVTHGTDTMEETAYLLSLVHGGDKPVVLTGAQRTADEPDSDGPRNLRDAIAVAASDTARGCGTVIVFAGALYDPARTRKHHTIAAEPFRTSDGGPIGTVRDGVTTVTVRPVRPPALPLPDARFDATRVDVVAVYPGVDAALAEAAVAAGAKGVILAGTGTGNATHAILDWVRAASDSGVAVGLSTRVAAGPVVPIYGNGGGVDLVAAGALQFASVPLFHARLLLALLLATGEGVTQEMVDPYR